MKDKLITALAVTLVFGPAIGLAALIKWVFLPYGLGVFLTACGVTVFVLWLWALWLDSRPRRL